jgi:hypothetical protein
MTMNITELQKECRIFIYIRSRPNYTMYFIRFSFTLKRYLAINTTIVQMTAKNKTEPLSLMKSISSAVREKLVKFLTA